MEYKRHLGNNVKRLREILGIKQDALAVEFEISQQAVSDLEKKSDIDNETLEKIAKFMKIPVEAIKNFDENGVINIISSTLHDSSGSIYYSPAFNPIDKVVELYDKMLSAKDEQIAFLKEMLGKK
jgi:transcriptional regulator with XRE-family HTH domain